MREREKREREKMSEKGGKGEGSSQPQWMNSRRDSLERDDKGGGGGLGSTS